MTSVLVTELISRASQNNTNIRHVTREIGIPDETVKDWMRGTVEPTEDEVRRFCEKLGVDIPKIKSRPAEKTESVEKSKILRDFAPNKELVPNSLVIGEETKPKKEEKKMEEIKNVSAEVPKTEEKTKRTRTISVKKTGKKQFLSEESEAFVRKSIGLKKSEEITEKALSDAFKAGVKAVKEKLDDLALLEYDVSKALFSTPAQAQLDERLKLLIEAAEKASDEGIEVAITILKKFRK